MTSRSRSTQSHGLSQMHFAFRMIALPMLLAGMSPASAAPAFEVETVCRTAIAAIMDRDPRAMKVTKNAGDVLILTYDRPVDNFIWTYRCRIQGNRVVWASEPGRWRDGPKDDQILFEVVDAGRQLRIIAVRRDGSRAQQLFDRDAIR
jgi:hypothetical protein